MENILSSIRDSVEQETAKVAAGEVLALSVDDMLESDGIMEAEEELIDINAFADSGAEVAKPAESGGDVLGVDDVLPTVPSVAEAVAQADSGAGKTGGAEDEFDKLLAELGQDAPAVEPDVSDVEEPVMQAPVSTEQTQDGMVETVMVEEPAVVEPEFAAPAAVAAVTPAAAMVELPAIQGTGGLQVAFPADILAAALRPMVKDWVAQNLPAVVERLVREEIAKLGQE